MTESKPPVDLRTLKAGDKIRLHQIDGNFMEFLHIRSVEIIRAASSSRSALEKLADEWKQNHLMKYLPGSASDIVGRLLDILISEREEK